MAKTLFIRIDPTATEASWQLTDNGQLAGPMRKGRLADAARYARSARNAHVVVCVPAEETFISFVTLPGKNRSKQLKAAPYAVEDQLVGDIESLHFSLSVNAHAGQYLISAVEKRLIEFWDKSLKAAGIHVDAIIPDVMLLSSGFEKWTILLESDRALVRTPLGMFSSDISNLPMLVSNLYQQAGDDAPDEIIVYDCSDANHMAVLTALTENIRFDVNECSQSAFAIMAKNYDLRGSTNLLQGEYGSSEGIAKYIKPWYSAAGLVAVWLVWQLSLNIVTYYDLKSQSTQLTQQMAKVYKQAFPKETPPSAGYERADMQKRLSTMRNAQGKSEVSFQDIFVSVGPILKRYKGLKIRQIKYRNGVIELALDTKESQLVDKFKTELTSKTKWQVEIKSRNSKKEITQVRITVSG